MDKAFALYYGATAIGRAISSVEPTLAAAGLSAWTGAGGIAGITAAAGELASAGVLTGVSALSE